MRVLIHSPAYLPALGGLEVQTACLARELARLGDEVAIVTRTESAVEEEFPADILRRPSAAEFLRRTRWCEVVLHQNLSLRGLWPLAAVRRPLVVAHHSWYRRPDGSTSWRDRVKKAIVARASGSISVSHAIAAALGSVSVVVPNAYRAETFRADPRTPRDRALLFVGRLVSDKGADLLLAALARLAGEDLRPDLTLVGSGPERAALERQVVAAGLGRQVTFAGPLSEVALAEVYRRHRVLVVPSRYEEPFGIVALEGIACGCAVVGSIGGGLPEAIGPCGVTFPNGDVAALAAALRELLGEPALIEQCHAGAAGHLARHRPEAMAAAYRRVLAAAAARGGRA